MSNLLPVTDSCPVCFRKLDAATDAFGDARPKAGDVSVCFYCGTFLTFTDDLRHATLSDDEFVELNLETRKSLVKVRNAINAIHQEKGQP